MPRWARTATRYGALFVLVAALVGVTYSGLDHGDGRDLADPGTLGPPAAVTTPSTHSDGRIADPLMAAALEALAAQYPDYQSWAPQFEVIQAMTSACATLTERQDEPDEVVAASMINSIQSRNVDLVFGAYVVGSAARYLCPAHSGFVDTWRAAVEAEVARSG